ncbi:hypothetical protein RCH09_000215 [Actimicrobium sp. GrIS 1.19]|nr:hypothetical protein [Actimicrobium sp. GrIS 1.19]
MHLSSLFRLCCLSALALATVACAEDPVRPTSAPSGSAALLAKIHAEIGAAACDSAAQCHTIGIGAKSCGGPEAWLAWSDKHTDPKKLQSLVAQHRAAREEENRRSDMVSDCRAIPDPGSSCVPASGGGVCRLNRNPASGV